MANSEREKDKPQSDDRPPRDQGHQKIQEEQRRDYDTFVPVPSHVETPERPLRKREDD